MKKRLYGRFISYAVQKVYTVVTGNNVLINEVFRNEENIDESSTEKLDADSSSVNSEKPDKYAFISAYNALVNSVKEKIEPKLCLKLIRGFVNFLINNMQDVKKYNSFFSYSTNSLSNSRLAWCYGDLSIGFIVNKAAIILNDMQILNISSDILRHSTQRTDLSVNMVNDACICHGTAGIAHIFNKLYKRTQNHQFKIAAEYWYQKTIKMSCFEDGIAGYKYHYKGSFYPTRGFLEGVVGTGISLMSGFYNTDFTWDECLLLS